MQPYIMILMTLNGSCSGPCVQIWTLQIADHVVELVAVAVALAALRRSPPPHRHVEEVVAALAADEG